MSARLHCPMRLIPRFGRPPAKRGGWSSARVLGAHFRNSDGHGRLSATCRRWSRGYRCGAILTVRLKLAVFYGTVCMHIGCLSYSSLLRAEACFVFKKKIYIYIYIYNAICIYTYIYIYMIYALYMNVRFVGANIKSDWAAYLIQKKPNYWFNDSNSSSILRNLLFLYIYIYMIYIYGLYIYISDMYGGVNNSCSCSLKFLLFMLMLAFDCYLVARCGSLFGMLHMASPGDKLHSTRAVSIGTQHDDGRHRCG